MQSFDELKRIMARLRAPDGCPWDREQSVESLRDYVLEECYELLEALDGGSPEAVLGELGDLLFQIVFLSRLYEEQGHFDLEDVAAAIAKKMVLRHPHVFGDSPVESADEVLRRWGDLKSAERGESPGERSILDGVPRSLPALQKSRLLSDRASHVGFDWPEPAAVLAKVREEINELEAAVARGPERARDELGDLLFSVANLARKLGLNPEDCLQRANEKFSRRFRVMEALLKARGRSVTEADPDELEAAWNETKQRESGKPAGTDR